MTGFFLSTLLEAGYKGQEIYQYKLKAESRNSRLSAFLHIKAYTARMHFKKYRFFLSSSRSLDVKIVLTAAGFITLKQKTITAFLYNNSELEKYE